MASNAALIFLLFSSFLFQLKAQYISPKVVSPASKSSLEIIFPSAKFPVWKELDVNIGEIKKYEATFTYNNKRTWATIDTAGNLFMIEIALDKDSIPQQIIEYLSIHHKFKTIIQARSILLSEKNLILIIVKSGKIYHTVLFGEDCTFLESKSNLGSIIFAAFVTAYIIPDFGIFRPFKIKDSMVGPPKFKFKP